MYLEKIHVLLLFHQLYARLNVKHYAWLQPFLNFLAFEAIGLTQKC